MKVCRECGIEKTIYNYYSHKGMKDGKLNICKTCKLSYAKKQRVAIVGNCINCGNVTHTSKFRKQNGLGNYCSQKCSAIHQKIKPPTLSGSAHGAWKGDDVGYSALHNWVERQIGKADYCWNKKCSKKSKTFHLSNISGDYKRDITDWQMLCVVCHSAYDRGLIKILL